MESDVFIKPQKEQQGLKDVMTVHEVARQLRVSDSTIRRMIIDGRIEGIALCSGSRKTYRVERAKFLEMLRKNGYRPA